MTIATAPSTFEFACNWLVSSQAFVKDALDIANANTKAARAEARLRIHREDAIQKPDDEEEPETEGDLPTPIDPRPLAIIITRDVERRRIGTGTWTRRGQMAIAMEVIVPAEYRANYATDTPAAIRSKYQAAKAWAQQLCDTIQDELEAECGRADDDLNPYLNGSTIRLLVPPTEPERGESRDYIAWIYEVEWQ